MENSKIVQLSIITLLTFGLLNLIGSGIFLFYPLNPFVFLIASIFIAKNTFKSKQIFTISILVYSFLEFISSQFFLSFFVSHQTLESLSDNNFFIFIKLFSSLSILFLGIWTILKTNSTKKIIPLLLFIFTNAIGLYYYNTFLLSISFITITGILYFIKSKNNQEEEFNWWLLQNFIVLSTFVSMLF